MSTIKVTFPIGIEINGQTINEVELRPGKLKDYHLAQKKKECRGEENLLMYRYTVFGMRLTPALTGDQMLEMDDRDFEKIVEADMGMTKNLSDSFRGNGMVSESGAAS